MTLDQIITELKSAELPPTEALRAAVPQAAELAPDIYRVVDALCRGVCLQPADERLLLYGLHVLAAARHEQLWPNLVELARVPGDELNQLFQDHADGCLTRMMLSVWDGDADALLRLIEHADMCDSAKWALFDVLARLTFDGRIPRERTAAFLERFESEELADDDSAVWWGWESAVTKLGLVALEPALLRVRDKIVYDDDDEDVAENSLALLRRCAAAPTDPATFESEDIKPIEDPVAAFDWLRDYRQVDEELLAELGMGDLEVDPLAESDPGRHVRPTPAEATWLDRFLTSRQVSSTAMSLEMLDGYLTGITIGPGDLHPDEFLPQVWSEDGQPPAWDGEQQAEYVTGLVLRHWQSIRLRREANAPQLPFIMPFGNRDDGAEWAEGFMLGVELRSQQWRTLLEDRRGSKDLQDILALAEGDDEDDDDIDDFDLDEDDDDFGLDPVRDGIIERLPQTLQRIAAYWRNPAAGYARQQPVRVTKVGRNDPCPCGSGRKYKKCCALNPPPTLN